MSAIGHRIAAVVLAAGRSTRMAPANKLLADLGGVPVVRRVAETVLASRAHPVVAVTGHQASQVKAALGGLDLTLVSNPDFGSGLASSLKAGIRALPASCDGALILLGDMPQLGPEHLDALIGAFRPGVIIVPTHAGRRGNPVLWPAAYFPELLGLEGDAGAKSMLAAHAAHEVDLGTDAIFVDIDTPDALARVRAT